MIEVCVEVLGIIRLVEIVMIGGVFCFILGVDGCFIDVNGCVWIGLMFFEVFEVEMLVGDIVFSGSLIIIYLQDFDGLDFVGQMKQLGFVYVDMLLVWFYVQFFIDLVEVGEFVELFELIIICKSSGFFYVVEGLFQCLIMLSFELLGVFGNYYVCLIYNIEDYVVLIGQVNFSL